ncbi:hypothetical protein NQ176_g9700 [Zarea fungicola]|uniref:Uncharacterized protein n=1 Tax=Zarea fungicola TaxID=93591 RepID=A0ACC1MK06_9HYPO|nr:hypothetical protein NQ176_g9700 [Lecanicillium fungicola]
MIGVSGKRISIAAIAAALMAPPWTRVNAALGTNDPLACDNFWITITNQTQVDFYKTCPVISSGLFYIDPKFSGPFNAPGIESTSELIAGFYGPKLGDGDDRAENFVTSISMPDLKNTTGGHGVSLGYLEHLTNVSLPRLETTAALFVAGTPGIRNLTLPSLSVATSGVYLDGHFDVIDLPSLKSAAWIKVLSLGNLSCPALATAWATVNLTVGTRLILNTTQKGALLVRTLAQVQAQVQAQAQPKTTNLLQTH